MVAYYKLVHGEPEYRAQMLVRADGKWIKREDYDADLAAARAEIERLTKQRDNLSKLTQSHREQANEQFHRANKAEAERDKALSKLADAERDMRQRAAEFVGQEARTFPDNVAWGVEDVAKAILALPLKHTFNPVKEN